MKRRENIVAATYKPLTASERAMLRQRGHKRRSSIQHGVVCVHFVKLLPADAPRVWPAEPEPAFCVRCKQPFFQADGEDCLCHRCWAASLTQEGA